MANKMFKSFQQVIFLMFKCILHNVISSAVRIDCRYCTMLGDIMKKLFMCGIGCSQ